MVYVYVLYSRKDKNFYIGMTKDLRLRFEQHNDGYVISTKNRRPIVLVYYEACLDKRDAAHREKYLKTSYGKRFIISRLKSYFMG